LWEIVHALERRIDLDQQHYEIRCRAIHDAPQRFRGLRFCDIPWPVRDAEIITAPGQLKKSEVRRFLFARCIFRKYIFTKKQLYPEEILEHYRRFWDPKLFQRRLPWYSRAMPSFATEHAAVLEGVALIRQYLDELEEEDWEVVLSDNPSEAEWTYSSRYRIKACSKWDKSKMESKKWFERPLVTAERISFISLGLCLATEAILYAGFLRSVQSL